MIDFTDEQEVERWLEGKPREVGIALAARSALRVLPLIGFPLAGMAAGTLPIANARVIQSTFRALAVSWIASSPFGGPSRLRIEARASQASEATSGVPPIVYWQSPAASSVWLSAGAAARAVFSTGTERARAIVSAIGFARLAEAGGADPSSVVALAHDAAQENPSTLYGIMPLWPDGQPAREAQHWQTLKMALHDARQNWQVWTIWYDDRLDGRTNSTEREEAYVDVPDDLWLADPTLVNAHIIRALSRQIFLIETGCCAGCPASRKSGRS
jgi:hypothetical protein